MFETHSKQSFSEKKGLKLCVTWKGKKRFTQQFKYWENGSFWGNSTRKFPQQILIWNETREKLAKHIFSLFSFRSQVFCRVWEKILEHQLAFDSNQYRQRYQLSDIRNNKICNFDLLKFVQTIHMRAQEGKGGERQEIYIERTQRKLKMHFSSTQNRIHLALTHTWREYWGRAGEREGENGKKREKFIVEVQWTANKSHKRTSCTCFNELFFEDKLYRIEWVILDFN